MTSVKISEERGCWELHKCQTPSDILPVGDGIKPRTCPLLICINPNKESGGAQEGKCQGTGTTSYLVGNYQNSNVNRSSFNPNGWCKLFPSYLIYCRIIALGYFDMAISLDHQPREILRTCNCEFFLHYERGPSQSQDLIRCGGIIGKVDMYIRRWYCFRVLQYSPLLEFIQPWDGPEDQSS